MPAVDLEKLTIILLKQGVNVSAFDCGDDDLNAFLKGDAFAYADKMIAKTYVALYDNQPIAFISVCADAIRLSKEECEAEFGREKTHKEYPAVKIARLATDEKYKKQGVGTKMVEYAVGRAAEISKNIGCRFVTVDAYSNQQEFYENRGFLRNQKETAGENVSMRLDLFEDKRIKAGELL